MAEKTSKTSGLSGLEMRVAEKGVPCCVAPKAISAHKGRATEPIGESPFWQSETQDRQRLAVASNERFRGPLLMGKATPLVGGSQSSLAPTS